MFIDAHVHIDKYDESDLPGVLAAIEEHQIATMAVTIDVESFVASEAIARQSPLIVASFGVQPWEAPRFVDRLDELQPYLDRSPFIGEIGLDYRFVEDPSLYPGQREVFRFFLDHAAAQGKLINVHTAGAERDCVDMIVASGVERTIIHWYSGPLDVLEMMVDAGFWMTVGVELLVSDHIRDIARRIPDNQLLIETDNPGGHRWLTGDVGYPPIIRDVVEEIARVRGESPETVIDRVRGNMLKLIARDDHLSAWASVVGL